MKREKEKQGQKSRMLLKKKHFDIYRPCPHCNRKNLNDVPKTWHNSLSKVNKQKSLHKIHGVPFRNTRRLDFPRLQWQTSSLQENRLSLTQQQLPTIHIIHCPLLFDLILGSQKWKYHILTVMFFPERDIKYIYHF